MWAKLLFLLLYVCVLFLLARFFEAVSWCETGIFASRLVDPVALSLRKLRGLLESRGLSHAGLLEKRGLARLVEDSGDVSEGELYSTLAEGEADVDNASSSSSSSADFTSEMHFYEQVEDTKDGVWLVQISCKKKHFMLEPKEWKEVVKKVSRFGIRTGTFHCSLDPRFCMKRGWLGPSLIMAVPLTNTSKGKVVLKEFHGRVKGLQHILEWVHASVAARIAAVRKPAEFWDEWRRPGTSDAKAGRGGGGGGGGGGRGGNKVGAGNSRVKVFLFANLDRPPMFLSAVSVKFTGRVRFIFVDMRSWRKEDYERRGELNLRKLPAYIIQTPEGTYEYGTLRGEHFSHRALDIFLRFLQPEVNDLFVLSLVLVNAAAWMDLFITQGATIKRFVVLISTLGTYNTLLILSWLPIVGLLQLPHLDTFYEYSLKFLRFTNTTKIASWVRTDWMFYSSHPAILLGTYLAHGLIVDLIEKKRKLSDEDDEILMENNLDWLSSLWEYYSNYLFRPIGSFPGYPTSYYDGDLEDGIDVLLERLAVPDLWLRPSISTDYIKYLPTWEFKCAERIKTPARAAARTRAPGPGADEGCRGCSASRADDDDDDGDGGEHSRERGASHVPPHGACPSCKSAGARGGRGGDAARISPVCSRNAGACEREFGRCVCGRAGGGERGGAVSGGWTEPTGRVGAAPAQAESPCGQPDGPRRLPPTDPRVVADSSASDSEVEREVEADWSCWPRGSVRGSECVVCLEAYSLGCLLTCLPCGHAFHARCIAIWLEGGRHCCPVCRWLAFRARPQQAAPPAPPGFTQHAD